MYIKACRAHFCHLLGLGKVGHSPRETSVGVMGASRGPLPGLGEIGHSPWGTSGSAGTLDWGPMWLGSQSTCHLQCTPTLLMAPMPPTPLTPLGAPMPLMPPIPLLAPEYLHSLPAPNVSLTPPTSPDSPQCPPDTPYTT